MSLEGRSGLTTAKQWVGSLTRPPFIDKETEAWNKDVTKNEYRTK